MARTYEMHSLEFKFRVVFEEKDERGNKMVYSVPFGAYLSNPEDYPDRIVSIGVYYEDPFEEFREMFLTEVPDWEMKNLKKIMRAYEQ